MQYINIKKILKKNLFFSGKKIDLYQAIDIFWEKKFKIISLIIFFVIIFFLLGLIKDRNYYLKAEIISNYNRNFPSNENKILRDDKYFENHGDFINLFTLDFLKEISTFDIYNLNRSGFILILEKNFENKNLLAKFLKTNTKVDYPNNFYVKAFNGKLELFFDFNKDINNKFLYEYLEYIFDLSFLEFKDITIRNLKMEISAKDDLEIICDNFKHTIKINEHSCTIFKEKIFFYERYKKKLEKMERYKDFNNDSIYFKIVELSPEVRVKQSLFYMIYGFLVGFFLSLFLFFNDKNKV